MNIISLIIFIISSQGFIFAVATFSLFLKSYLLGNLILKKIKSSTAHKASLYLILVLISSMISDLAWITVMLRNCFFSGIIWIQLFSHFCIRLAWLFNIIQYFSLSFLLKSLIEKKYKLRVFDIISGSLCGILCAYFFYITLFTSGTIQRTESEFYMIKITAIFNVSFIIFSLILRLKELRYKDLPKILKKQMFTFLIFFISPFIFIDILQVYPFSFATNKLTDNHAFVSISTILITLAMYFSSARIIGLRFLNFQEHVQATNTVSFIDNFKAVLEQLGQITSINEVIHIVKSFLHKSLKIPQTRTNFLIRALAPLQDPYEKTQTTTHLETSVENFISMGKEHHDVIKHLNSTKILIYDEIAFTNFYNHSESRKIILNFLDSIHADIFLPIYDKQIIVAYIIVERDARNNEVYNNIERDEMLVLASYLGNIIYLLQNKNLDAFLQKEKDVLEDLHSKHQEINQYKESIRSFLRNSKERKIGLIFYKNRRFIFGNQTAQELIGININTLDGHPLTKALKNSAQLVQEYKVPQSSIIKDAQGNRMVITGLPNLENNNVILMIYYPEIADIIKEQMNILKDPSEWDYLLYLETTKSGQLINKVIPGNGPTLLQFKINILKTALSKKATLIEAPKEDLMSLVEILHLVSLRQQLHTISLQGPTKNFDIAIKLFGINPIFAKEETRPLLEQLHETGTLFIENIHFLDLETQNYLAEYIRFGFFHLFKGDQRITSSVRIICSSTQNLQTLVQEGKFSAALLGELKKMSLAMPSLLALPEQELIDLADALAEQTLQTDAYKNLLTLSEREKNKIATRRPMSLLEFKDRIQQLLIDKSKKNDIYHEVHFDPAYHITDPELAEAARLGKQALRDPKIMTLLWNKFKNQNKIATFLGVNRSSVNRRCKDYNLN